jgi:hypothetical protein
LTRSTHVEAATPAAASLDDDGWTSNNRTPAAAAGAVLTILTIVTQLTPAETTGSDGPGRAPTSDDDRQLVTGIDRDQPPRVPAAATPLPAEPRDAPTPSSTGPPHLDQHQARAGHDERFRAPGKRERHAADQGRVVPLCFRRSDYADHQKDWD